MSTNPSEGPPQPPAETPPDDWSVRSRLEQLLPDVVRRAVYAGVGAVFSTEDGLRRLASELKLPKEVASFIAAQASASKDELLRLIGRELSSFLSNLDLSRELQKLLTSLSFEIRTEVRFIPNDQSVAGVKPDIKKQVTVRRVKEDKPEE